MGDTSISASVLSGMSIRTSDLTVESIFIDIHVAITYITHHMILFLSVYATTCIHEITVSHVVIVND